MLPVEFRPSASAEAEEARDFLEGEQPGLGQRFTDLLSLTLERVGTFPESSPEVYRTIRCVLVPTFRYRVFYQIESTRIVVLAVRHPARDNPDLGAGN